MSETERKMSNKTKALIAGGIALFGLGVMANGSTDNSGADRVVPTPAPVFPTPTLSPTATPVAPQVPAQPVPLDAPKAPATQYVTIAPQDPKPVPTVTVYVTVTPKPTHSETANPSPTATATSASPTPTAPTESPVPSPTRPTDGPSPRP